MTFTCLSVINPWPWVILRPDVVDQAARGELRRQGLIKDCENRDWETPQRGWVLLQASKTRYAKWDYQAAVMFAAKLGVEIPLVDMPYGAVVGAMRIDGCHAPGFDCASKWRVPGKVGFEIGAAVAFAEPVLCDGKPRFFQLPQPPDDDEGRLLQRLVAAVRDAGLAQAFGLEPAAAATRAEGEFIL